MNLFEEYLKQNKNRLNMDEVNPEIWLNIENEILRRKNHHNRRIIYWISGIAAAISLLLIIDQINSYSSAKNSPEAILAQYDLQQFEYPQQVNAKTTQLKLARIPNYLKGDFEILINQLSFLDKQYQEYLVYIQKNGYQKFIGKQLANYYETKIELLDKIQSEIEKIQFYEDKKNNTTPLVDLDL